MKILFWVTGSTSHGTFNFSITGEGSIEEECQSDALQKAKEAAPLRLGNITLQKFAYLADEN